MEDWFGGYIVLICSYLIYEYIYIYVCTIYHPVTKMYVKGGRGGVCNIHFTVVHFFYWGILAYNFQKGGGGAFF